MIRWNTNTNCITEWTIPSWSEPLRFSGWGCEVGNFFGFFAHERLGGCVCKIQQRQLKSFNGQQLAGNWQIAMPKAKFFLSMVDKVTSPTCMLRSLRIKNISKDISWIGDAVIRLVVPWQEGLHGILEQKVIDHKNKNSYYDTEDKKVALVWQDGRRLTISWVAQPVAPPSFTPYLYLRDQPSFPHSNHVHSAYRAWVVHARLLVDQPASFVYRWSKFTFWDRGLIGRYIVSPRKQFHRWRAAEWKLPGRGTMYGLWPMLPEQELLISIKIRAD